MILVDTSVWVDFFAKKDIWQVRAVSAFISRMEPVCINGIIEMEIKQGVKDDNQLRKLEVYLKPFQELPDVPKACLDLAAEIFRTCRKHGVTIRRSLDCIIAAHAISENLVILHKDRDFDLIASVFPELNIFKAPR